MTSIFLSRSYFAFFLAGQIRVRQNQVKKAVSAGIKPIGSTGVLIEATRSLIKAEITWVKTTLYYMPIFFIV
jgi:hypothetical protein